MGYYRSNGVTNVEVGKLFRSNGVTTIEIGKLLRSNGVTNTLVYEADYVLLNGNVWASGYNPNYIERVFGTCYHGYSLKTDGLHVDVNAYSGGARGTSCLVLGTPVDVTNYKQMFITHSMSGTYGGGRLFWGLSPNTNAGLWAEGYSKFDFADGAYSTTTATLDISSLTGNLYVDLRVSGYNYATATSVVSNITFK